MTTTPSEQQVFTFARVDPESLAVTLTYNTNGGSKWAEGDVPCEIPFDVLADQAVRSETGEITLVSDPTKVQAKTDAQWTQVRSQQKQKLYESDWTCSVTDYEVPNKSGEGALLPTGRSLWVQYRQALRDVTTQSDPFEIVWPSPPSA